MLIQVGSVYLSISEAISGDKLVDVFWWQTD